MTTHHRHVWIAGAALWLMLSAIMLWAYRGAVAGYGFTDTDDIMRLLQVREWVHGASWFDVGQPRMNAPTGGLMHWSRLVDLPIAALYWLFEPFVGGVMAERWAAAFAPLVTLAVAFAATISVLIRLCAGRITFVVLGMVMVATLPFVLLQFVPLRIDHHGWQIALVLVLLRLALAEPRRAVALSSGAVTALLLSISLEGLPMAVLFAAIWAMHYLADGKYGRTFLAYMAALSVGALCFQLGSRGVTETFAVYCDALSRPYLAAMVAATLALAMGLRLRVPATVAARTTLLAVVGGVAIGTALASGPVCAAGPFAQIDPVVMRIWHAGMNEGLPLWRQPVMTIILSLTPTIMGIIGAAFAYLAAADRADRRRWLIMLACTVAGLLASLGVTRSMSIAHALAVPGLAALGAAVWIWARRRRGAAARLAASALIVMAHPLFVAWPLLAMAGALAAPSPSRAAFVEGPCAMHDLARLPRGIVFAPLDISPTILLETDHSIIAASYHRNDRAMRRVIEGFVAPATQAEAIVRATGARYVAVCLNRVELSVYGDEAQRRGRGPSLVNDLVTNRPVGWLAPVAPASAGEADAVRVWRVLSAAETSNSLPPR